MFPSRALWQTVVSSVVLLISAQASDARVSHIMIPAGVPLHIALDQRTSYASPGKTLEGHLTQPVYVGQDVVLPVGTRALGRVKQVRGISKQKRFDAIAAGDFTPLKDPTVEFYSLIDQDGREVPIQSTATNRDSMVVRMGTSTHQSLLQRLKSQAIGRVAEEKKTLEDDVRKPHKFTRLKYAALARLPYHPQVFEEGAKFVAELTAPASFNVPMIHSALPAYAGLPPTKTVLHARLISDVSSAKNHWGDPVEAVLTEPIFGPNHELVLPEGTHLLGQVTHVEPAKRWARNGKLTFAFRQVALTSGEKLAMKGRLTSVETDRSAKVTMDEEGATKAGEPKARYLMPLAMVMASHMIGDDNGKRDEQDSTSQNGVAGVGFGLTGRLLALSAGSRYIAYGIGYYGAARSIYAGFIGRGKDLLFPKNTQLEIRMDAR